MRSVGKRGFSYYLISKINLSHTIKLRQGTLLLYWQEPTPIETLFMTPTFRYLERTGGEPTERKTLSSNFSSLRKLRPWFRLGSPLLLLGTWLFSFFGSPTTWIFGYLTLQLLSHLTTLASIASWILNCSTTWFSSHWATWLYSYLATKLSGDFACSILSALVQF